MADISIVVPVCNVGVWIAECLGSLVHQTLREIEIICVDDGSTDDSVEVIRRYMAQDDRIRLVEQPNCGTVIARKRGAARATGEYILFVDPDDALKPEACERLYAVAKARRCDILQFGVEIRESGVRSEAQRKVSEAYFNPPPLECRGREILKAAYLERKIPLNVIFRLFRASVVKAAFEKIPDLFSVNETDVYAFFHLAAESEFFSAVPERYYLYRYGVGVSTKKTYTLEEYRRTLGKFDTLRALTDYVASVGKSDSVLRACRDAVAARMTENSFKHIFARLGSAEDQRRALAMLREKCGALPVVECLAQKYGVSQNASAAVKLLAKTGAVSPAPKRPVKRIGLLYYHLTPGGIQRVIVEAVSALRHQAYEPVLILEKQLDATCYPVPNGVRVRYVPEGADKNAAAPVERVRALAKILSEEKIDLLYSHQHVSHTMLWDLLTAKWVVGIPFVLHFHNLFTVPLHVFPAATLFLRMEDLAPMCDAIICLSRVDERYFAALGARATYVVNPVDPELRKVTADAIAAHERDCILWVGRLSWEKHPLDAVHIFALVHARRPSARFVMVGGGTPNVEAAVRKAVTDHGLADCVTLTGATTEVYGYYARASVFLTTPAFEGFGMTSLEALSFGLPIVSYAAPQLELYRDNDSVSQVPECDTVAAADALIACLENPDPEAMHRKARQSVERFLRADFGADLRKVFEGIGDATRHVDACPAADLRIMLGMYFRGIAALQKKHLDKLAGQTKAERRAQSLFRELESVRTSEAYRVGMFVTAPFRAIKRALTAAAGRL